MLLVVIFSAVFVFAFSLLFVWIRKENKKENAEEKMHFFLMFFTAFILALLLAGVAAFFLFLVLGSTNVINALFTLDMSKKDMILMSIVYLVFLFTLDNVFQIIIKLLTKNIYLFYFLILWLRMVAFYLIGNFFHLAHYTNVIIAGGVALILSLIEFFYEWRQLKKQ